MRRCVCAASYAVMGVIMSADRYFTEDEIQRLPVHIAAIMDGNGRWAKSRGRSREYGHTEGVKTFEKVVDYCGKIGIQAVTVYAFSTENWKRPKREVDKIMSLLERYIDKLLEKFSEYDVRVRFIGTKEGLSEKLTAKMARAEKATENNPRLLNVALNYGSREELTSAVNRLLAKGRKNITAEDIGRELYTYPCPDPDLIVRTAGEQRLSNFLLWQAAYSEFYFTDTLWPDFGEADVEMAVSEYYRRTRRYGGLV